ncbi:MAG: hypothetical protein ABFR95_11075 [Actinomycetota bacterium]
MQLLILASETPEVTSHAPAGDDWATVAYILLGIVMLVAAIGTALATPKGEH